MAAQKGSSLLLRRNGVTAAGLRTKTLAFNGETVDITNSDSTAKWRELLEGAGIKSASLSGAGVFTDAAVDESIRGDFFAGAIITWQVVVPDFGTIAGPFQISALQYAGEYNGEVTWDVTLESAGAITFT